ncbi:Response regulator protein VraR [Rubrobacter xylanophilus DSM 9941]|uniref:response regulator n=1 Tax=Rubrobacter xylanophilus TaxID=49319 RepID=UPI001C641922|nr:response regulator transcription factor [Rubrobacter xylanophilus]QYJ16385.1 Response regulator protein VraR [Rubrobacter xylanophilus DSM 9941]
MSGRIGLLICDDHPVVRTGLKGMLAGEPDLKVVGEAADGRQAVELCRTLRPDLVLMDLRMPEMDGVAATESILAENPQTRVLVLTTYDSDADILRAVEAGASGYLLKDASREELFAAIRTAMAGESPLDPAVASRLMRRVRTPPENALSGREIEVLDLVAQGASNREIARRLWISETTVKTHLLHIYEKLGVADRTAAVTAALRRGIIRL